MLCDVNYSFLFESQPTLLRKITTGHLFEIHSPVQNPNDLILYMNGICVNDLFIENGVIWPDPNSYYKQKGNRVHGKITAIENYGQIIFLDTDPSKKSTQDYVRHIISTIDVSGLRSLQCPDPSSHASSTEASVGKGILYICEKGLARATILRIEKELLYIWLVDSGETKSVDISKCFEVGDLKIDFPTCSKMCRLYGFGETPLSTDVIENCLDCLVAFKSDQCVANLSCMDSYIAVAYHIGKPTAFLQALSRLFIFLRTSYPSNNRIVELHKELEYVIRERFYYSSLYEFIEHSLPGPLDPETTILDTLIPNWNKEPNYEQHYTNMKEVIGELKQVITTRGGHIPGLCHHTINIFLRFIKLTFTKHESIVWTWEHFPFILDYLSKNIVNCKICCKSFVDCGGVDVLTCLCRDNSPLVYDVTHRSLSLKLETGTIYNAKLSPDDVIDITQPNGNSISEFLKNGRSHWIAKEIEKTTVPVSIKILEVKSSVSVLCEIQDGRVGEVERLLKSIQPLSKVSRSSLKLNAIYILLTTKGNLFRIKLNEIQSNNVKVLKIDAGDQLTVPVSSLFECPQKLKQLPSAVIDCRLYGVHSKPLSCELLACLVSCVHSAVKVTEWPARSLDSFISFISANFATNVLRLESSFLPILKLMVENKGNFESASIITLFPCISEFLSSTDEETKKESIKCIEEICNQQITGNEQRKTMILTTLKKICGLKQGPSKPRIPVTTTREVMNIGNRTNMVNDSSTHLIDFEDVMSYDFSELDSVFVSFLNSESVCKIYFGVDKEGVVKGTNCNSRPRRDSYRLTVDRINGRIRPNLIQQCMKVDFVTVGEDSICVVVITIDARYLRMLFCDLNYVYWKRTDNGICVKMSPNDIQIRVGIWAEKEILNEMAALKCRLNH